MTITATHVAGFLTPLNIQDVDGERFMLLTPLIYKSKAKVLYVVPEGFVTDLASIPWGLLNIIPKVGKYNRAATLHDFLYQHPGPRSRRRVDDLFREAMDASDVRWTQRQAIWSAVRLGGWVPWRRYRAAEQETV